MEFKGSKGYYIEDSYLKDENHVIIADFFIINEKDKANALLISKAPILLDEHFKDLEFLEKIAKQLDELGGYLESDVLDRIEFKKQLIKQATEL